MRKKRYNREVVEEILGKIRGGQRVREVARVHGINESTIRGWVEREADGGEVLEMSRLKREN